MAKNMKGAFRRSAVVVAFVAVGIFWWSKPNPISFSSDSGYPNAPLESILTGKDIEEYKRDGFLLIRNFSQGKQLTELMENAEQIYQSWHPLDLIFRFSFAKITMQVWRHSSAFAKLAFESSLPSISAQLMSEKTHVRILKDALFGYTQAGLGCGFHVDDKGFWPAKDGSNGVQFWLALSPMRATQGGGIRVTNRSVTDEFSDECLAVIRSGGFNTTCRMAQLSPFCNQKLMDASVTYDMEPGDLLVWDRMTFHRTEPFHVNTTQHKLRYTIRYIPSNARAEGMVHPSIQQGDLFNTPYYPQVWPKALKLEVDDIQKELGGDLQIKRVIMGKLGFK